MVASRRVAILTGASSGIGYAVAEQLAKDSYAVVLGSRNPEAAAARLRHDHGVEVTPVVGDLSDPETTRHLVEAASSLGGVDALLLNHGGPPVKAFVEVSDEEWERWFRLMILGPLRLFRACVSFFQERGVGRVVAITSFTVKAPFPGVILSNSLRAGLVNALKTAAQELGKDNILCNAVAPGYIATDRLIEFNLAYAKRERLSPEVVDSQALATVPLGRYGAPSEVAELAAFLLSERNGYISGQQFLVDGGLVAAL